ncbi:MAG: hypothetical protein GY940_12415 [bacterium]|nr:hypothetical protein [bacterium]
MKKENLPGKKLTLNKKTITRLNSDELKNIQGQERNCSYPLCWEATQCFTICRTGCMC